MINTSFAFDRQEFSMSLSLVVNSVLIVSYLQLYGTVFLSSAFLSCPVGILVSAPEQYSCVPLSKSIPVLPYLFPLQASKESTLCNRPCARQQWCSLQPPCGELWEVPHFSVQQGNPGDSHCPTAGEGELFCINSDKAVQVSSVHCSLA